MQLREGEQPKVFTTNTSCVVPETAVFMRNNASSLNRWPWEGESAPDKKLFNPPLKSFDVSGSDV